MGVPLLTKGPERPWMDGGLIGQSVSAPQRTGHFAVRREDFAPPPSFRASGRPPFTGHYRSPHLDIALAVCPIAATRPMTENLPSCLVAVFVALLVLYLARLNQLLGAGATPAHVKSCTSKSRRWSAQRLHDATRIPPKQHRRYIVTGGSGECRPVRLPVPVEDGRTLGEGSRRTTLEAWITSTRQPFRL